MSRRRRGEGKDVDLPPVVFFNCGTRLMGTHWEQFDASDQFTVRCRLCIGSFVAHETSYYSRPELPPLSCWVLSITRKRAYDSNRMQNRTAPGYEATLSYSLSGKFESRTPGVTVLRGSCSVWANAVREVSRHATVIQAARQIGQALYRHDGAAEDKTRHWYPVRPFKVKYPWSQRNEPNRFHSPFGLVGGLDFDVSTDGIVASRLGSQDDVREFVTKLGGNAYLEGPDERGQYTVWHRNAMREADPIDIDDWRGRLVAGIGEPDDQ